MVGVVVSEQNGVETFDVVGQALQSKFGGGVHEEMTTTHAHEDAGSHTPVARIVGRTHITVAPDHRYAVRRPASQDDDLDG